MPRKTKTLDEVQAMQEKAVRFLRDVVGDPDKAEEFANMTPQEYAEHKRVRIENPALSMTNMRGGTMARPTRAELEDRVEELEQENQALNDKLDSILDIAGEDVE